MNIYATGRTRMQLGSGHNLFDWTYIKNAAWAHILAADRLDDSHPKHSQVAGQAFFVTNGEPRPFWEFPRALWRAAGWKETSPIVIPRFLAFLIAYISVFIAWILGKQPTLTPFRVNVVTSVRWCNIDRARKALDYAPIVSLDDGIRETVEVCGNCCKPTVYLTELMQWWKTTQSHVDHFAK
jgi:sterol-4alpha-carboxylate 3-dehydrogenase (decarboxylating)